MEHSGEDSSIQQLLSCEWSSGREKGWEEKTNCHHLGADAGESSLSNNATGTKEVTFCTSEPIVVCEWPRVLPVSEPDAIVLWTTTQIDNDTKNNHSYYCNDLDRARMICEGEQVAADAGIYLNQNSASPYAPVGHYDRQREGHIEKVLTDTKNINTDNNNQAHGNIDSRIGCLVPKTDDSCRCRQFGYERFSGRVSYLTIRTR